MALHKREEVDNKKKSLVTIHSKQLINDSNYFYAIDKGKVKPPKYPDLSRLFMLNFWKRKNSIKMGPFYNRKQMKWD